MRAMTWFDHETESVWSQPWGLAIDGAIEGTRLKLIPAGIMPWDAWLSGHPDTLVLDAGRGFLFGAPRKEFSSDFVIGIAVGEAAKAYPFLLASQKRIINDRIGTFPVVVLADPETRIVSLNKLRLPRPNGSNAPFRYPGTQLLRPPAFRPRVATGAGKY